MLEVLQVPEIIQREHKDDEEKKDQNLSKYSIKYHGARQWKAIPQALSIFPKKIRLRRW